MEHREIQMQSMSVVSLVRTRETIIALCYDLVTNIQAQYEELQGSSNCGSYDTFLSTFMVGFTLGGLCKQLAVVVLHHA